MRNLELKVGPCNTVEKGVPDEKSAQPHIGLVQVDSGALTLR